MATTTTYEIYDFSKTSRDEFMELFEFASKCNATVAAANIKPAEYAFISILLATLEQWRPDAAFEANVIASVKYALGIHQIRLELTEVLFKHGAPTRSQIETVFRLLFQVAYIRQQLVTKAEAKAPRLTKIHV
jgi:predicted ATPase